LEAYEAKGDQVYDVYIFLVSEGNLKLLQENASKHETKQFEGESRIVLTLMDNEGVFYECYDLGGTFLGVCDQAANIVE
jgi:hypothetical protein